MELKAAPSPEGDEGPVDLARARISAVVNLGSGHGGEGAVAELGDLARAAGLSHAKVVGVAPAEVDDALKTAIADAEVVIVLGGDGTIRAAAEACEKQSALLVPLPGGTMNMLPKALYGALSWQAALAATLANPEIREVSGGKAAGGKAGGSGAAAHAFFCVAILGAPSLWADAREALRAGHLVEAAKRSVTATRRSLDETIDYRFGAGGPGGGGCRGSAEAVAVICPAVSAVMPFDERAFEAVALDPKSAAEAFRLAWHAASDGWRRDPSVTVVNTRAVEVAGHGHVPVILDGEKVLMGRTVRLAFQPLAFRALVPAAAGAPQAPSPPAGR